MDKMIVIGRIVLVISLFFGFGVSSGFGEDITLTTFYPSPYGVYQELRSKRLAIGDNYVLNNNYCWGGGCVHTIDSAADLVVEGKVGIGTVNPRNKLDVEGSAVVGASYSGTDTAPNNGMLVEGKVGIGTTSPESKLSVGASGSDSYVGWFEQSSRRPGGALYGIKTNATRNLWNFGVMGRCVTGHSAYQVGVYGHAYKGTPSSSGRAYGVRGMAGNEHVNSGVFGMINGSNDGAGVFGGIYNATPRSDDRHMIGSGQWAGYFDDRVYIRNNLGIGVTSPNAPLEVDGEVRLSAHTDMGSNDASLATKKYVDDKLWVFLAAILKLLIMLIKKGTIGYFLPPF
jgi:hypothetical protein